MKQIGLRRHLAGIRGWCFADFVLCFGRWPTIPEVDLGRSFSAMIPTPSQLFALFERGDIEREELQALMASHARELIAEMEEDYQNPAAAWIESLLARQAAGRLARRHGRTLLREVLVALGELPDFPPARHLWNAGHPDVPLHCFLRMRREPVFRILQLAQRGNVVQVLIEHGDAGRGRGTRRTFILRRDDQWRLRVFDEGDARVLLTN